MPFARFFSATARTTSRGSSQMRWDPRSLYFFLPNPTANIAAAGPETPRSDRCREPARGSRLFSACVKTERWRKYRPAFRTSREGCGWVTRATISPRMERSLVSTEQVWMGDRHGGGTSRLQQSLFQVSTEQVWMGDDHHLRLLILTTIKYIV